MNFLMDPMRLKKQKEKLRKASNPPWGGVVKPMDLLSLKLFGYSAAHPNLTTAPCGAEV